ncbi:MAG: orotidine-5'-phosphate decarboxylase [Aggregatilineales bacterium]
MTFIEKLSAAQTTAHSYLCVGLDPDPTKFPVGMSDSSCDLLAFCTAIIDATADLVSAYKPNLAFFLARGATGIEALQQVIAHVPANVPTILDAKFGDMDNTAAHYATFAFEYLRADAVTLSPYLGTDAIRPFIRYPGKLAFVLARTSNVDGNEFQTWPNSEQPLYQHVAEYMNALAASFPGQIGLVVGATHSAEIGQIRALTPDLPFLVPGIGAQGGDLIPVLHSGSTRGGLGPVINVSRAVLYAGQDGNFAQAAREAVIALNQAIGAP